jgi:ATP-dependent DNA helicase RecG
LLEVAEDQWFDRKAAEIAPRKLAEALVGFANAEGGTVVVGLSAGVVQGLSHVRGKLNEFRQVPFDYTTPPVRADFSESSCMTTNGKEDTLLVIRIEPSERVHETSNGSCFLRVGDETRKLNYQQRRELEFDKGQTQYDGLPADGITFRHMDARLVANYRATIGMSSRDTKKLFRARSLITPRGGITNAGYLLFGSHPQDLFPQAYVRVLRFLDIERGTGSRLGLEEGSDLHIEGPIPRVIQRASKEIEGLVPRRRALSESGLFEPVPIVPRDAWLEGLVNAVIHRSYSLAGDHIRVEIYPNRIEIESPGRFPGLANPSKPLEISRYARNPRIARVCADLRIGQELGEGIKRIFDEMRRVGLTDPIYEQASGSVRLTLAAVPRLDPRVARRLPVGSQQVLDTLRSAGGSLGTGELAETLDMSRPTLKTRLKALEKEGLVLWNGKSPQDPRAVWILTED